MGRPTRRVSYGLAVWVLLFVLSLTELNSTSPWEAYLTVNQAPPDRVETIQTNPLGVYVTGINWTPVLLIGTVWSGRPVRCGLQPRGAAHRCGPGTG